MVSWAREAVFYHIYPLGFCGAPEYNDFKSCIETRLNQVLDWVEHMKKMGTNAVYFGPVFESGSHGYDTADYFKIDRRLGSNEAFADLCRSLKKSGFKVVIDGVFNHAGRNFEPFRDLLLNCGKSLYLDWFGNIDFSQVSPCGDPFSYSCWNGHNSLVKLNLSNRDVKNYLFGAVEYWIKEFDIDGIRLDCADCLDLEFLRELRSLCKSLKHDFWLMGEVIHGDYNIWVNDKTLDSVTNYECYKGLYSSHNDKNYFEIAYSLNRQFGEQGIYKNLRLYTFADNHDVDRIASTLHQPAYLYPLHILLFTMPGIPSIYYGSEWGIEGKKTNTSDNGLRPEISGEFAKGSNRDLVKTITRLAELRKSLPCLINGEYRQLFVRHQQFGFCRITKSECIIVLVNSSDYSVTIDLKVPFPGIYLTDLLNGSDDFAIENNMCQLTLYPCWGRILKVTS